MPNSGTCEYDFSFYSSLRQQLEGSLGFEQSKGGGHEGNHVLVGDQRKNLWQILAQWRRVLSIPQGDAVEGALHFVHRKG